MLSQADFKVATLQHPELLIHCSGNLVFVGCKSSVTELQENLSGGSGPLNFEMDNWSFIEGGHGENPAKLVQRCTSGEASGCKS